MSAHTRFPHRIVSAIDVGTHPDAAIRFTCPYPPDDPERPCVWVDDDANDFGLGCGAILWHANAGYTASEMLGDGWPAMTLLPCDADVAWTSEGWVFVPWGADQ